MYKWKVVPLCKKQLLDVKPNDILSNGLFRTCDVYKSGGGYDKFPAICEKRLGRKTNPKQFVVQLYGCHLKCPYCYVTNDGVFGDYVEFTTEELVTEFRKTGLDVFHLMGGSPALYMEQWPELIEALGDDIVFHSDLTLTEFKYGMSVLRDISKSNCLYAVNIKGVDNDNYKLNTGCEIDVNRFTYNIYAFLAKRLVYSPSSSTIVPFYFTFTNPDMNKIEKFYSWVRSIEKWMRIEPSTLEDSFIIDLVEYEAIKGVREYV